MIEYLSNTHDYQYNEFHFIMAEIDHGNYSRAIELMEEEHKKGKRGKFATGRKYFYEFAIKYCNDKSKYSNNILIFDTLLLLNREKG